MLVREKKKILPAGNGISSRSRRCALGSNVSGVLINSLHWRILRTSSSFPQPRCLINPSYIPGILHRPPERLCTDGFVQLFRSAVKSINRHPSPPSSPPAVSGIRKSHSEIAQWFIVVGIEKSHVRHVADRERNFVMRELVVTWQFLSGRRFSHLKSPWNLALVPSLISSATFIRSPSHLPLLSFCKRLFNCSNLVSMKFALIGSLIVEMAFPEVEVVRRRRNSRRK